MDTAGPQYFIASELFKSIIITPPKVNALLGQRVHSCAIDKMISTEWISGSSQIEYKSLTLALVFDSFFL